ncbi:MAG: MFS transporter [Bacteriovoracaceae bacterium]|nr:MFS transporter [Bacteriovoracaceae bacterium]
MNDKHTSQVNWKLLFTAYFSLLCHALFENGRGPAYPRILEFYDINSDKGSLIFALSTLTGLFINLTSKWWLPKFGAIKALRYASIFMFFGCFSYYLFPSLGSSFTMLILGSCIAGLGTSGSAIPMNLLAAKATGPNLRRRALAGLHGIYGLTSLTAPLLFSVWINKGEYWYSFFLLVSLFPFLLYFMTYRNFSFEKHDYSTKSMKAPVSYKTRFLIGLCFALYVSGEILISSRLVFYLQEVTPLTRQMTEWALGLFFLFLTIGRLSFAFFHLPISSIKALFLSLSLSIICMLLGLYVNLWFLPLTGLFVSFFFPVGIEWLAEKFESGLDVMTASMFTWVNFFLIFMHYGFGIVVKNYNIQIAFTLPVYFFFITLVILSLLEFKILKQKD